MLKINTFLILLLLLADGQGGPKVTQPIIYAVIMGLSARYAYDWSKNTLTIKTAIVRPIFAILLVWVIMNVYFDFDIKHNIIYAIVVSTILATEIINEGIKLGEMGLKEYMRRKVNNFLGKDDSK